MIFTSKRIHVVQAGLKIGMSDGGLVTEAKPSIQWDKVGQTKAQNNDATKIVRGEIKLFFFVTAGNIGSL